MNTPIDALHDGNVIEISQYNHGMHSGNNKLEISNVRPTTAPVVLNAAVGLSTNVMLLDDPATGANATLSFQEFEGVPATGGFVIVNNEIMEYSSVDSNNESLYISKRGISNSAIREHAKGSLVYKYEFNGFSLTGINTDHQLPSTELLRTKSDIDKYYIEVPRSTGRTTGDDMMNFFDDSFGGGTEIFASQNILYNQIYPRINFIVPGQTTVSARIRTVSGTSAGGNEVSFLDQGFEDVQLDAVKTLSSPRLIASPINETARLNDLP